MGDMLFGTAGLKMKAKQLAAAGLNMRNKLPDTAGLNMTKKQPDTTGLNIKYTEKRKLPYTVLYDYIYIRSIRTICELYIQ